MIAQSLTLPNRICNFQELYIKTLGEVQSNGEGINIGKGSMLSTDTYMNLFDAGTWLHYTEIRKWKLRICLSGKGSIRLICWQNDEQYLLEKIHIDTAALYSLTIPFFHFQEEGMYYFEIEAETQIYLKNAYYMPQKAEVKRNIQLGLIICTYHRQKALYQNLQVLRESRFFDKADGLFGKLKIYVIDNASELPLNKEPFITIHYNPNTGGSGGFTRGIEEIRKNVNSCGFTNVIFMDDDVEVLSETFFRLYALLAFIKEEYQQEVIAGRMFRMDQRQVQYTAAEIWNAGDIQHIGWNLDMTEQENLIRLNDNTGAQYGGWWFASFPMSFVLKNTPLPFFIHCDDVEYGIRHGGNQIILNGIQVWHETYEYRQSPVIMYYDTRNSLIVNSIYSMNQDTLAILIEWKKNISQQHVNDDYFSEYMLIQAMWDFIKGPKWFFKIKSSKLKVWKSYKRNSFFLRVNNALFWRLTDKRARAKLDNILKSYQQLCVTIQ